MLEKIIDRIYITGGIALLITVIIAMSSCSTGYQVSNCPGLAMEECINKNK